METTEIAPLLSNALYDEHEDAQATFTHLNGSKSRYPQLHHVLPIAFLAALAMSSTAATGYYAYATLLCKDARHCNGDEARTYKKFIATTISVSNVLGMIALGPLQKISRSHRKLGLLLWLLTRSMNAVMLLLGGKVWLMATRITI